MNPKAFTQQLEMTKSKTLCSFFGESYYLVNKAVSFASRENSRRSFNAKNNKREEILNAVQTSSSLFGRHIVVLSEADFLKRKALEEIIERKDSSAILILVSSEKLNIGKDIFILPCKPPYENEMMSWVLYLFLEKQRTIEISAAQFLAGLYGRDLDSLAMEVEKIISYAGSKKTVSESDVLFVTRKNKEHPIFHLLQGWKVRPLSEYVNTVLQLKASGEQPLFIFNMLVRECKKLLEYKIGEAQGLTENEVLRKLKVPAYFGRALIDQANRFSLEELEDMTRRLATSDYSIKSGKTPPWNAIESSLGFISKR